MEHTEPKSPYCMNCNKNVSNITFSPHVVKYSDAETKPYMVLPSPLFVQCGECGYVFGIIDSTVREALTPKK